MKKITYGKVHKALVDSINNRWIPLRDGKSIFKVPACQLCKVFGTNGKLDSPKCKGCPLTIIGDGCINPDSSFKIARGYFLSVYDKDGCQRMINQLQKCLDTFFPNGIAEE